MKLTNNTITTVITGLLLAGSVLALKYYQHHHKLPENTNQAVDPIVEIESPDVVSSPPLPDTLSNNRKKKINRITLDPGNTIPIIGPIGMEAAAIAQSITQLSLRGSSPIYVVINSPGGSVLDGALIVSAIQASSIPVYTVCLQLCASQAAIIHQYGTKRMMVDRAVLMFHDASGGIEGTFPQMRTRLAFFDQFVNKMDAEIAKRIGITLPEFKIKIAAELWLDAEDATKQNFNDSIVDVTLESSGGDQGPMNKILASQTKQLNNIIQIKLSK